MTALREPVPAGVREREALPLRLMPTREGKTPKGRVTLPAAGGISLMLLVPGIATVILTASLFVAGKVAEDHSRLLLVRESEARLVSEARQLALAASTAMLDEFPELRLAPAVRKFASGRTDLEVALVVDVSGHVQGAVEADRIGAAWKPDLSWRVLEPGTPIEPGEQLLGDAQTLVVLAPVRHPGGQVLGTAVVGVRREVLERAIERSRREQGLLLAGVLGMGCLVMALLMFRLVSPLSEIRRGLERIGHGDLDGRIRLRGATEFRLLAETLNRMAEQVGAAQRQALEKERLQSEIDVASRIHQSLLPAGRFRSGDFLMVGAQRCAAEVGGDYYDYITGSDGRVTMVMADVAGKGVAGALIMSMFASLLRAFCQRSESPSALLVTLEQHLGPHLDRQSFVTVWIATLDPDTGEVAHASAGHLPTLVVRAGGSAEWFRTRAVPMGIAGPAGLRSVVEDVRLELSAGDLLIQMTDGITEAIGPDGREQFGFERVTETALRWAPEGPDAVVKGLLDAVAAWTGGPAQDDETVLAVMRVGSPRFASAVPASVHDVMKLAESYGTEPMRIASLKSLDGLRGWIAGHPVLGTMEAESQRRVELGLYEISANVLEHGYRRSENPAIDLWWVPDDPVAAAGRPVTPAGPASPQAGTFVLRDHGRPFDPGRGPTPDLRDPATRRQGRGFGLELARRILSRLRYFPSTPHGNLTLMRFDHDTEPEVEHE